MKSFKDYYEEKVFEEDTLNESVGTIIGKILGFGTLGVAAAWGGALLVKGGTAAFNSIMSSLNKVDKAKFKEAFKLAKKNPAIENAVEKQQAKTEKYEEELKGVFEALDSKNVEAAQEEFEKLSGSLKNSYDVKQVIIQRICKNFGYVISGTPTPGTKSFQVIRALLGLAEAKAAASAFEENMNRMLG